MTKYPNINVQLSGDDGNAFFIIARVSSALKKAGVPQNEIDAYRESAMSGDYDNVLSVTMNTVSVS